MFRHVMLFSIPNWLFYVINTPKLLRYWLYCIIRHKEFFIYRERVRILNEIRNTCRNFGEKDKKGNWNLTCKYKYKKRSVAVKVRFNRKAIDDFYDKFKKQVENFTYPCTKTDFRGGYARFEILLDTSPLLQYESDNTTVSLGATHLGLYKWDFSEYPHGLIIGESGQGKSTFVRYLINSLLSGHHRICMIDGKMVDYSTCSHIFDSYAPFNGTDPSNVLDMISDFKAAMYERLEYMQRKGLRNYHEDTSLFPVFLLADEFQMIADSLDKKKKQVMFDDLAVIIRLGRAVGYFFIGVMQTAHSDSFPTTLRDNCQLKIVLGNASKSAYQMCFGDSDIMPLKKGKAWFKIGTDLLVVSIPNCKEIVDEYLNADQGQIQG